MICSQNNGDKRIPIPIIIDYNNSKYDFDNYFNFYDYLLEVKYYYHFTTVINKNTHHFMTLTVYLRN